MICDPNETLYRAFGLGRGTLSQLFGPSVWKRGFAASLKGNFIGPPGGQNVWTMPGAFLIDTAGTIVAEHRATHAGDHAKVEQILELSKS